MDLSREYTGTGVYRHKICNVHSIDGLYTEAKISFPPPPPISIHQTQRREQLEK